MSRQATAPRRLDVAAVIAAALRIADADGLEALSMRRLAAALDVTPMALYNHVDSKDRLVDLMADESLRALPEVDVDGAWEPEVRRFFAAFHRLFVAHPAVAEVTLGQPFEGPVATRLGDRVLELLVRNGFGDAEAAAAFVTLFNYTVGASLYRLSRDRPSASRLGRLDRRDAPTAHRLRRHLIRTADEQHVDQELARIVAALRPGA